MVWDVRSCYLRQLEGGDLSDEAAEHVCNRAAMLEFACDVDRAGLKKRAEGRATASHCNAEQWIN